METGPRPEENHPKVGGASSGLRVLREKMLHNFSIKILLQVSKDE